MNSLKIHPLYFLKGESFSYIDFLKGQEEVHFY